MQKRCGTNKSLCSLFDCYLFSFYPGSDDAGNHFSTFGVTRMAKIDYTFSRAPRSFLANLLRRKLFQFSIKKILVTKTNQKKNESISCEAKK